MNQPVFLKPGEKVTTVGRVFGAPLVLKGWTWLPANEAILWAGMTAILGWRYPAWSMGKRLVGGFLSMVAILGSEWCHNLAHAAAAQAVGKPADAIRIFMGMPLLVYHPENDARVSPREHILRALGGPAWNGLLLVLARFWRGLTRPGTLQREVADAAVGMNTFLVSGSLLPVPGIDGGTVLQWTLRARGQSPLAVAGTVKRVNRAVGAGLGVASALTLSRKQWLLGALCAGMAVMTLAIGFGWGKEKPSV